MSVLRRLSMLVLVAAICMGAWNAMRVSDTPECCVKKSACCPTGPCCSGGKHTMGAACPLN